MPASTLGPLVSSLQPTCDPAVKWRNIQDLLRTNGDCELPCLWTLCPGVTNWASLHAFTDQVAGMAHPDDVLVKSFDPGAIDGGATFIGIRRETTRLSVSLEHIMSGGTLDHLTAVVDATREEWESGELVRASTAYGDPRFREQFATFLMPSVLSSYGKPSQFLLLPVLYDPPLLIDSIMSLVLLYEDRGFLIEYVFPNGAEGDDFIGCPSETGAISIVTWSPETEPSLGDTAELLSAYGLNALSVDYYKPIEEATSLTSDEFYELLVAPEKSACLKTPRSLWPY